MPSSHLNRREWIAGASAGAAGLLLDSPGTLAQPAPGRAVVFSNTTIDTVDAVRNDVALAVEGDRIAAIGPTDEIRKKYPQAEVYDGRGKALFLDCRTLEHERDPDPRGSPRPGARQRRAPHPGHT